MFGLGVGVLVGLTGIGGGSLMTPLLLIVIGTLTAVALGVVLGFILGVTSVGSGALIGLALILVFRLTPHRVVSTDVFHAAVLLWAAGIAHVIAGNVDYGLMGNILVGSIPGVLAGAPVGPRG